MKREPTPRQSIDRRPDPTRREATQRTRGVERLDLLLVLLHHYVPLDGELLRQHLVLYAVLCASVSVCGYVVHVCMFNHVKEPRVRKPMRAREEHASGRTKEEGGQGSRFSTRVR